MGELPIYYQNYESYGKWAISGTIVPQFWKMVRFEGEMVNPRVFEKADVEYSNAFSNISAKVYI